MTTWNTTQKISSNNVNNVLDTKTYIDKLDEEEKKKIKEIFDLFDKNLDGGIDIKELKFILNTLDINPNHDELTSMMYEADVSNKDEEDFLYIIAKQKDDYKNKLVKEARDSFIALGGNSDLSGNISTKKIKEILKGEFNISDDLEKSFKKICHNKEELSFEEFMKFFQ